ncbi:hypothetical protein [Leptospira kmetyi]|uniref:hypothetical protein n=1 Tax=Leptospira kmetyi TaxID=408139 RepID=UPI00028905BC|nr:hypothetical protein [Leptospira kmetyi]EQA52990.1 hypothetical protein LEP1GSC052_1238 [Leptospira kmetyi serovar Malaysia str. Bejo-Iso9]
MPNPIQITRFETENTNPLILIPDFEFPGRTLYADLFVSSYDVRIFELLTNRVQVDFPKWEEWIETLSREILTLKRKVKIVGEGLFAGIVFELLKRHPQTIESACVLNPPLSKSNENFPWLPKNVDWILERFPWNPWFLLSGELHSFYESLEKSFQFGLTDSDFLPALVLTKSSGKITNQIQNFGETIERFPVFRIEASDSKSVQPLVRNLVMKILAEVPISSVQKKSKFKIEPGF